MKTKLEMAHEWYMKHGKDNVMEKSIACAWAYADAMQAEADKREKEEQDKIKQNERNHHDELVFIGLEEWQPDWSQAPKNMNYFFVNKDGSKFWTINEPDKPNLTEHVMNFSDCCGDCYAYASLQDYQGDWRNSLRKRPQ